MLGSHKNIARVAGLTLIIILNLSACAQPSEIESTKENLTTYCEDVMPQREGLSGATAFVYKQATGKYNNHRDLRIHIYQPTKAPPEIQKARPAILFFFGGGFKKGRIEVFSERAKAFAQLGYVTALADYSVKCRDGASLPNALGDAKSAFAWLADHSAELGIDPQNIVLSGGSAGGYLALTTGMLAPRDAKPSALILFNPVTDIVSKASLLQKIPARTISPNSLSKKDLPPTIIFHGLDDNIVPIADVRNFCEAADRKKRVCDLHGYVGHTHAFFHSKISDPNISTSPYNDTHAKSVDFLRRRINCPSCIP